MHETYEQEGLPPSARPFASARLGIIGGGQLARMTALAALPLGCEVSVLERNPFSPAAQLIPLTVTGDWSDDETLRRFVAQVDVVTLENEFVDAAVLRRLEDRGHKVFPSAACIALTQDKLLQKEALVRAGLPVAEFCAVDSPAQIAAAGEKFGWPLVLKTRRNGYDGKGNATIHSPAGISAAWETLRGDDQALLVEAFWRFSQELAVIVTRGRDGNVVTYPVVETVQRDHVCHVVRAPAAIAPALADQAAEIARRAVTAVGAVGSFGVELFLSETGAIAINELAPRVHNSGHYTIEACVCSQFENHVRAVLGWPLGSPRLIAPAAVMLNVLGMQRGGGRPLGLEQALAVPGAFVHLYGKAQSGAGRKMGHITALGQTTREAMATAQEAARALYFEPIT
ncbi:5-(carboxyamino)imidazole ribonucleotide synthase [Horticoccus sp. 23ND18S-11]|uniref:5-(carboxyamino)imidazole ribonucleotide synthase n=1 Tax=Horticoccus sp. 23ND18S-11 TaxID=3391832 RepID=UPI0039C973B9